MEMLSLINELWPIKRSLVSDGYDKAIYYLAQKFPLQIMEFPSGKEYWTWVVPEKWTCHEAYLETLDGRRLIDYQIQPLHCVEYSTSIDKVVTRDELFSHLHVHPKNPQAIPYVFKFYERDWGLCCSGEQKAALRDPAYKVVIKTSFEPGTLKVGEWWLPGKSDEIIVLTAHLCHPCLANDDLSGIVVGLGVMQRLSEILDRYYTYLLLLVPETIGSIAWLSQHEELIPKIKGGLFLEMLGTDLPLALQRSYPGNTQLDLCCEHFVLTRDRDAYVRDFWEIIRNDELEYNSPGVRIPMVSLSRVHKPESKNWPYPEYHTDLDTPAIISEKRLNQSSDIIFGILAAFDKNYCPKAKFKGQVFCSRYGIFPKEERMHEPFFKTLFELDGEHSIMDIVLKHGLSFQDVLRTVETLACHDLVLVNRRK